MTNNLEISNLSLLLSSVLLIVALLIDYKEKLGLGNDILLREFALSFNYSLLDMY